MLIHVTDTETAQVDKQSVCEVAFVSIDPVAKKIVAWGDSLINPNMDIDAICRATHHIDPAELEGAPQLDVWMENNFPKEGLIFAHNSDFDKEQFGDLLEGRYWADTLALAKRIWPDAPRHANQVLRYWLQLDISDLPPEAAANMHRALYDTWCTAKMVLLMLETHTPRELYELQSQPLLLTNFRFGNKHKNVTWEWVAKNDMGYLKWMNDKCDNLDADTKHTLNHWLTAGQGSMF